MDATPGQSERDVAGGTEERREHEHDLILFLEHDQLVDDKAQPVGRASLGPRARLALWVLRVFVLMVSAMVIYTFIAQLGH